MLRSALVEHHYRVDKCTAMVFMARCCVSVAAYRQPCNVGNGRVAQPQSAQRERQISNGKLKLTISRLSASCMVLLEDRRRGFRRKTSIRTSREDQSACPTSKNKASWPSPPPSNLLHKDQG